MKKFTKAFLCAAAVVCISATFTGCFTSSPQAVFRKKTGIAVPQYGAVTTIDTTGFFGDGELIYQFYLDEADGQTFENRAKDAVHWQSLPMDTKISNLVYDYCNAGLPKLENGYYFFYDEHTGEHCFNEQPDEDYSHDYVLGMYDSQSYTVYYYEFHS